MEEIRKERERIKKICKDRFDEIIKIRKQMKRYRSRHTISISGVKRALEDIYHNIDHADYERKT